MRFTPKQHMKAAALMQSKAKMAKPENRKVLLDLAKGHRILARKAAERELRLAGSRDGERDPPDDTAGGGEEKYSVDLRYLLNEAPAPFAPLASWMQFLAKVHSMPDFIQKAVVVHCIT